MSTIILTGGGTAGHCIPHLAIYPYIKKVFDKAYYIGSENGIEKNVMGEKFEYFPITTAKLKRKITLDNLLILPRVLKGAKQAEEILKNLKPDLVFSKGGFVSVPVVFAASKLKIPVVCHESDYSLGLANKITAKKCKYVLTSFEPTAYKLKNGVFTGPPIIKKTTSKKHSLQELGLKSDKPVLLVVGGSLGSQKINAAVRECLSDLTKNFQVLHLVGKNNLSNVKKADYKEIEFLNDMSLAYASADIAISRAGSGVCFELMNKKIPTLFIPLSKKESRGDQILNAQYFLSRGACRVLYEENLTKDYLLSSLKKTYDAKNSIIAAIKNNDLKDGNEKIAQILLSFV